MHRHGAPRLALRGGWRSGTHTRSNLRSAAASATGSTGGPAASPISPFGASSSAFSGTARADVAPQNGAAGDKAASRPWSLHSWNWRGHNINYATAGCGRPVVLVHGFGASLGHYRKTIPALAAEGYKVYALDLLGFGASDKPLLPYSIELWAELVAEFTAEFTAASPPPSGPPACDSMSGSPSGPGAVLVGNSIGSLVCLAAAASAPPGKVAGLCLLNSAGAMNNKGVISDWRIALALPLFWLIDLLLSIRPVARALFDNVRDRETLAKVLQGVYRNPDAVDDDLVDIIAGPSYDENALDVFVSVITGPAGPRPWDLLPRIDAPIFIAWGDRDPFTPVDGPVGKFMMELAGERTGTEFALLPDVGHCPQDDRPELLHARLMPWLAGVLGREGQQTQKQQAASSGGTTAGGPAASVGEADG